MSRRLPTVVVAGFLAVAATSSGRSPAPSLAALTAPRHNEALVQRQAAELKTALASPPADVRRDRDRATLWKTMRDLYASRGFEPIWIDGTHPARQFDSLVAALQEMRTHGIDPERYDVAALTAARAGTVGTVGTVGTTTSWFRTGKGLDEHAVVPLDIKATRAWMRGTADLSAGAADVEGPADKLWRLRRQKIDFQKKLASAIDSGSLEDDLKELAPTHAEYVRLKDAYKQYVAIADAGGWKPLPALALKKGDRSPHLPALAKRLEVTGDLEASKKFEEVPEGSKGFVYDDELAAAVAHFQLRHGLKPDGVLGRQVVAELNVPVGSRIRQLELNLERWRWLPRDLGERYIFVNVPEYRLEVHEGERVPLHMNVITGAKGTPTPIFRDTMTHIVFSPYWNVPDSIASGETLPAVQSDPSFLDRNRMEIVGTSGNVVDPSTVDWSSATDDGAFPYRFRQRPGSSNSLGLVKFVFPNEHSVYLHDTPADSLFTRAYRALSHGCVRLEQPQALAEYLLKDQPEWTPERITAAMHAGEEEHVTLSRPVPVHLLYWTARVSEDGIVHFRQDVYGRDTRELGNLMARK